MPTEYTCDLCGGTFQSPDSWGEGQARKEFESVFTPEMRAAQGARTKVVCDVCYREMMRLRPPKDAWDAVKKVWGKRPWAKPPVPFATGTGITIPPGESATLGFELPLEVSRQVAEAMRRGAKVTFRQGEERSLGQNRWEKEVELLIDGQALGKVVIEWDEEEI